MTMMPTEPIWPVLGTRAADALFMLCEHSLIYQLPGEDEEVQKWLAAISTLESFGWPVLSREIDGSAFGFKLGVRELAPLARQVIADKFAREVEGSRYDC